MKWHISILLWSPFMWSSEFKWAPVPALSTVVSSTMPSLETVAAKSIVATEPLRTGAVLKYAPVLSDTYINDAMAGKVKSLVIEKEQLESTIKKFWFLPMREEHAQLEILKELLNNPLVHNFGALAEGTEEQAFSAACRIRNELDRSRSLNLEVCPITCEQVEAAFKCIATNANISNKIRVEVALSMSRSAADKVADILDDQLPFSANISSSQYLAEYKKFIREKSYNYQYYDLQKLYDEKLQQLHKVKKKHASQLRKELHIIDAEIRNCKGRFLADLAHKEPAEAMKAWAKLQDLQSSGKLGRDTWERAQSKFNKRLSLQSLAKELEERISSVHKAQAHQPDLTLNDSAGSTFDPNQGYDLKLTTPTDSDVLHAQIFESTQGSSFVQGLVDGSLEQGRQIVEHPMEYAQEIVEANLEFAKQVGLLLLDIYLPPEEIIVSEREMELYEQSVRRQVEKVTQLYINAREAMSQMDAYAWGKLVGKLSIDSLLCHGISSGSSKICTLAKGARIPTFIKENPFLYKLSISFEQFLAKHPEMLTSEGMVFRVPQAVENTNVLKNAAEKNIPGGSILRVANMKEFFTQTDFGKSVSKQATKLNFTYKGAKVYKLNVEINDFMKKGYHFYLDTLHYDHLEVFNKHGKVKFVLNLDGTLNKAKTVVAIRDARSIPL